MANCASQKNNTKVLFVMMLMQISSLKNSYFYNEFKNDWNYWNGIVIQMGNSSNITFQM